MAKNNGVNELAGNEQIESIFSAYTYTRDYGVFHRAIHTIAFAIRRMQTSPKGRGEISKRTKNKKCKLGEYHAQVKNLALQKSRERTTKKLVDKQCHTKIWNVQSEFCSWILH